MSGEAFTFQGQTFTPDGRVADARKRTPRTCFDCKQPLPPEPTTGGTGYAVLAFPRNARVCYPCADTRERASLQRADRFMAYLSSDGRSLTTWTGGKLATVTSLVSRRRARWSYLSGQSVYYFWAVDPAGGWWHGFSPGTGCYARMRRSKSTPKAKPPVRAAVTRYGGRTI